MGMDSLIKLKAFLTHFYFVIFILFDIENFEHEGPSESVETWTDGSLISHT